MIASLLALAMAASPPQVLDRATANYRHCLDRLIARKHKAKASQAGFDAAMERICGGSAEAMRRAIVADDVASGVTRAEAEHNAVVEVADMAAVFRTTYGLLKSDPPPAPRR